MNYLMERCFSHYSVWFLKVSQFHPVQNEAPRVEQLALLNDELSNCVSRLDEFSLYLDSSLKEGHAELQLEQDLMEDIKFVNAGLVLSRLLVGDQLYLQKQLRTVQVSNQALVSHKSDLAILIMP